MQRRQFLKAASAGSMLAGRHSIAQAQSASGPDVGERDYWVSVLRRIAEPVLRHLASDTLKARMPVEQAAGADRRSVTHLEAFGRLVAGVAPWLDLATDGTSEGRVRAELASLTQQALSRAVDPASPDFLNFTQNRQPLVDAAFLAQGILRAPRAIQEGLDSVTRQRLVAALASTRSIVPPFNNWLLFSAMIEAGLERLGAGGDRLRVDYALRQHDGWYKGDGAYGDGPEFHWDYYNSFVIHPMLVDVLDVFGGESAAWGALATRVAERAQRYAAVQERLIGADGSFPPIGRSLAYRCGAFHLLAQSALRHSLPEAVSPGQIRGALTAVIRRSLGAPGTFDDEGWLRIGFAGHQPGVGESYISTGSLYLCAVVLLPLGLPASDEFWTAPSEPWTAAKAWGGLPMSLDHALD